MPASAPSRSGRRAGISPARRPTFFDRVGAKLPLLGFALRFLGWIGCFYLLSLTTAHEQLMHAYRAGVTAAAGGALRAIGETCQVIGETIASPGASVTVTERCSALGLLWCLGAAVLAYPARWPARLVGLLAGGAALVAINTLRVASLYWTSKYLREAFDPLHETLWPALLVIVTAGFLVFWISWLPRPAPHAATA